MSAQDDIIRRAQAVLAARGSSFATLADISGLDLARDFRGADLRNVQFGYDKFPTLDLREANLAGANLSKARGVSAAMLERAHYDRATLLPGALSAHLQLFDFWKDGCPSFVSAFGVDDYGQWFEFELAGPDGPVTQRMRWVAPGKFLMGSPEGEAGRDADEGPQHEVAIKKGFWLFDTACTQALWTAVTGKNPSRFNSEDRPVEKVSWNDARKFIAEINERFPGLNLSLPSEAQWEYACRAGTTTPFSFGKNITPEQVNFDGNHPYMEGEKGLYREETVAAGSLPANPWGLYEMHGNVWEWCADASHDTYDGAPNDGSAWEGSDRTASSVARGGSWYLHAQLARSASRLRLRPGNRGGNIGFRCSRVQDGAEPAVTLRIQRSGAERIAAAPSGEAGREMNEHGVEFFPNGAPLVLRGVGARRPVKPAWASAMGRDEYGAWAEISVGKTRQRLRLIKPGKFLMGSPENEAVRFGDEGLQREVSIGKGFWIFDTACTQALWRVVMGTNPSRFKSPDRSVEMVSWDDAQEFIVKINEHVSGLNLSLPSEAQWEYACRAGTHGMSYAGDFEILGQDNAPGLDAIAWYGGNSGEGFELKNGHDSSDWLAKQYDHKTAGTRRMKLKTANDFGLYDMLGNVWEWCADAWHATYDGAPSDGSVWESVDKEAVSRVVRGGSWGSHAWTVRSAYRRRHEPGSRLDNIGFRCVRVQA
jgi:formylglycine-generating enzyme required for sulfatase activity